MMNILVYEDNKVISATLAKELERRQLTAHKAHDWDTYYAVKQKTTLAGAILDDLMNEVENAISGISLIKDLIEKYPAINILVYTAHPSAFHDQFESLSEVQILHKQKTKIAEVAEIMVKAVMNDK